MGFLKCFRMRASIPSCKCRHQGDQIPEGLKPDWNTLRQRRMRGRRFANPRAWPSRDAVSLASLVAMVDFAMESIAEIVPWRLGRFLAWFSGAVLAFGVAWTAAIYKRQGGR